MKRYDGH